MSSARSLLSRLRKLEAGGANPILKKLGPLQSFEQDLSARVADGRMCAIDGPFVGQCVRRWVSETYHYYDGRTTESWSNSR